jgi:ABC-type transport system substrate-binding protein
MMAPGLSLLVAAATFALAACGPVWNDPYPTSERDASVLYGAFEERPKHLDPARSYSENEYVFIGNIYEPPLQYHYLKRPYVLEPLTAAAMPSVTHFDANGFSLPRDFAALSPPPGAKPVLGRPGDRLASADSPGIAWTEYEIRIRPGIRYQPHPCFAKRPDGQPSYVPINANELERMDKFTDFRALGTRELTAADYVYQIKRLASPRVQSPIAGLMGEYIVGLKALGVELARAAKNLPGDAYLDLDRFELQGAKVVDRYTYRVRIRGNYPQFIYWLSMPFFAPLPAEADRFYSQPGMAGKNFTLDWQPVGTGAFYLAENDPNRVMRLLRNPHYHDDAYPAEGDPGDAQAGLLRDAGKKLPLIEQAVFSLEKEDVPYWNKFLQGYYDTSGVSSDSFDQAIRIDERGEPDLTAAMRAQGIELATAPRLSLNYMGFNMRDPAVGAGANGQGERARKLRQAISIAVDYEEFISIFLNGRGLPAQGPIPPGIFGQIEGEAGINPVTHVWREGRARRRDIAEAKRLLAEAGYPNGRDAASGQPLTLYFDTMATGPDAKARLDWYRKQFAKLDLQLVIRATDYNRFQDKMLKGNAQIFEWGWNADYPDPENFLFLLYGPNRKVGAGGENAANYENAEFDALFARMKALPNGPERQAVIDRMVAIARDDAPWIFAFHPKSFGLRHGWVGNVKPNLMAHNTLKYRRVDRARREVARVDWNRPVLWPMVAFAGLLIAGIAPAALAYRRRQKAGAAA